VDTDDVRLPKTLQARVSSSPDRSRTTIVFSKVGGSAEPTIAAISDRCSVIPASSASRQCSAEISANGGSANGSGEALPRGLSADTATASTALIAVHPAP
jgi:hypothetical protein